MKKFFNKKHLPLIATVALIAIAGIGAVVAYGFDTAVFNNNFAFANYKTVAEEEFLSPDNWTPCEETPKVATLTNSGNAPVAVRMKIEEWWRDAADTQNLPLVKDGVTLVAILTQNESDWELESDGWYYYKETLAPGSITTSLLRAVKLDCNANFGGDNVCTNTASGTVCEKPADAYENAKYHMKVTFQTIQADKKSSWRELARIVKEKAIPETAIDFNQRAASWNNNGLGVNRFTENGEDVYYYRGELNDNNVIWADMCWRIVRTTYTGGTKIIYNGEPVETVVDGENRKQCLANWQNGGAEMVVNIDGSDVSRFVFNSQYSSPADVGYMYGKRYAVSNTYPVNAGYIFANDVDYDEDEGVYTLVDTYTFSNWATDDEAIRQRYHYTCLSMSSTCNEVHYLVGVGYNGNSHLASHITLTGERNIDEAISRMHANENDSNAKKMIELWFEQKNLDGHEAGSYNYEDDLEDAVFCNDRSYGKGTLRSKDSRGESMGSYHGANTRGFISSIPSTPTLDCSKNDAFTKIETATTNGKLKHKVGLLTADELVIAGVVSSTPNYLNTTRYSVWSMTPSQFNGYPYLFDWGSDLYESDSGASRNLRPVVSLKAGTRVAGGDGTMANPFTLE